MDINRFQLEDYAKKFFELRKKGVLVKKEVPLKSLLEWSKVLLHPLTLFNSFASSHISYIE
jgi:hypothetical protein